MHIHYTWFWLCRCRNIITPIFFSCKLETLFANFLVGASSQERMVLFFTYGVLIKFNGLNFLRAVHFFFILKKLLIAMLFSWCFRNWGLEKKTLQQTCCYISWCTARMAGTTSYYNLMCEHKFKGQNYDKWMWKHDWKLVWE